MAYEHRILNFSAGPAILPEPVLKQLQEDTWNLRGSGIGVFEHSHRGAEVDKIFEDTIAATRELAGVDSSYEVLFMAGGASAQFALIPMNFLAPNAVADYIVTGTWAKKAYEECARIGNAHLAFDNSKDMFNRVPTPDELDLSDNAAYLHYCTNNTIYGTRFNVAPTANCPLIADMSSEMFSRPWNFADHAITYAGAQKNLGPAGVALLIIKKDLLESAQKDIPNFFAYPIHAKNDSRYNTPPVGPIHVIGLVLRWILDEGGLNVMEQRNEAKAKFIYDAIDESGGFYIGHCDPSCRSVMNISFQTATPELDAKFLAEASTQEMSGLKGHRSIGGMRASIYNAFPAEGCTRLAEFMQEFARTNG